MTLLMISSILPRFSSTKPNAPSWA